MMNFNQEKMFHIGLTPDQGAEWALITGDPGRVEVVARLLDQPEFVVQNREFTTWAGNLEGRRVLVTSHGIGGPSTSICVEELARCGVKTLIRIGTCGGMALPVKGGDLVVATGAIRMEGTSREYLPVEFPAVADWRVTEALIHGAEAVLRREEEPSPSEDRQDAGRRVHAGVVQCKDSFYGQHSPEASPVSYQLMNAWQSWLRGGCLASEMESAALYIVAASLGLRAGCVLHVLWNQEREKAGLSNPRDMDTAPAARAAVEAVRRLMEREGGLKPGR